MSNVFNDFFVGVGENLSKHIVKPSKLANHDLDHMVKSNKNSMFLTPITAQEIEAIIKSMDISKSTPSSCSPLWFLRVSSKILSRALSTIFNKCISEGYFPENLKQAEVVPIYKAGSKSNASNYRPISLLNPFSKIFEKCIYNRLITYFNNNKLLYSKQFGFRTKCSTENAVLDICNHIATNLDNNEIRCSIFLDLKKAFDTVNYEILLRKLYKYGVRGKVLDLIQSFLTGRYQYTKLNGYKSSNKLVSCGVPQGSTLGPLLFIIYINDFHLCTELTLNLFADDSYLSLTDLTANSLETRVNNELKKVDEWLRYNKLSLNVDKSSFMIFTRKTVDYNFEIKIGSKYLKKTSQAKYLGVLIDENLSWKPHIKKIESKIASACWMLSKIKSYINEDILRNIYFGLVYPHLFYCISCWGAVSSSTTNKLFLLQKRAIRMVAKAPRLSPSSPLFKDLKLLKLEDIYKLRVVTIMFKINNGTWVGEIDFQKINMLHSHYTRFSANDNYYSPEINTNIIRHSFCYMGPKEWSLVPPNIKKSPIRLFKKEYSNYLMNSY